MPKRLQRKRAKGWRKPRNSVIVDRTSRWGNPFIPGEPVPRDTRLDVLMEAGIESIHELLTIGECLRLYRAHIESMIRRNPKQFNLDELRGKDILCFCPEGAACHGDVLMELANK